MSVKSLSIYPSSQNLGFFGKIQRFRVLSKELGAAQSNNVDAGQITNICQLYKSCNQWLLDWMLTRKIKSTVSRLWCSLNESARGEFYDHIETDQKVSAIFRGILFYEGYASWKSQSELVNAVIKKINIKLRPSSVGNGGVLYSILQRYLSYEKQIKESRVVPLPKWYHTTREANLPSILSQRTIEVRHQSARSGAWVSSMPEPLSSETNGYLTPVIALSERVELLRDDNGKTEYRLMTQTCPDNRIWHAFKKNVPVNAQTVAWIAVPKDTVEEAKKEFSSFWVISLEEMNVEYKLLSEIIGGSLPSLPLSWHQRITSSDRSPV
jgi:hypothetical protein